MAERKNVNNGDWDAKGDLLAGTANDAFDQVAVGANDTILTADSTVATGMKWAAPAAPSGVVLVSDFDAKGDILVGTANDAFDQLAVGANGTVVTADSAQSTGLKYALPPGYEVAQAQVTSSVVVTSTSSAAMDTVISLPATTYAAIPYLFEFSCSAISVQGGVTYAQFNLFDDTTPLSALYIRSLNFVSSSIIPGGAFWLRYVPTAGSHTFRVKAFRTAGTSITFHGAALDSGNNYSPLQLRATIV